MTAPTSGSGRWKSPELMTNFIIRKGENGEQIGKITVVITKNHDTVSLLAST